jgi:N-acetyl-anhydromuramyl-L-alanine amidase AmpD
MNLEIVDQILENGEFYSEETQKTTIYLHHTAGSHRPDWVINGWDTDDVVDATTKKKTAKIVATSFVIGGLSTTNGESTYDGKIYRAFDEKYWAHHLGCKLSNNTTLNKQSIGVEICNYGPITLGKDGLFYNYVNKPVPKEMVVKLDKPFRGYNYYHTYTDKQIEATKNLILYLKAKFPTISLKTPLLTLEGYELDNNAKSGVPGIYSHSNVREDKFDLSPQTKVIEMLKSISK